MEDYGREKEIAIEKQVYSERWQYAGTLDRERLKRERLMDTRTGEIIDLEELKKVKPEERKWYKKIPERYVRLLEGMNRAQRREWYRKNKKIWEREL